MKPLLVIIRIIIVGLLWSVFFMESIRVIMLRNWHFDIVNYEHWKIAWDLWTTTWVISEPKEWAFVFIVISFIPLWFTGWIALSMVSWGKFIWFIITLPWKIIKNIFYKPVKIITNSATTVPVTKRVSYKEIRPRALKGTVPLVEQNALSSPTPNISTIPAPTPIQSPSPTLGNPVLSSPAEKQSSVFDHALFKFDDSSEDVDFDIDSFDVQPSSPKPRQIENQLPKYSPSKYKEEDFDEEDTPRRPSRSQRRSSEESEYRRSDRKNKEPRDNSSSRSNNYDKKNYNKENQHSSTQKSSGSCIDIIKQKGFAVLNRLTIKNITIDYTAISADCIYLCLLDREDGDWLADEERFNDEEPLWFSENSHRISPVRKLDIVKQAITNKLADTELNFRVEAILIEQIGNIINAEDMLEIWDSMDIKVCRADRGMPKELQTFARTLPDADKRISSGKLDKITKILRNIE